MLWAVVAASPVMTRWPRTKSSPNIPARMLNKYNTPPILAYSCGEALSFRFVIPRSSDCAVCPLALRETLTMVIISVTLGETPG